MSSLSFEKYTYAPILFFLLSYIFRMVRDYLIVIVLSCRVSKHPHCRENSKLGKSASKSEFGGSIISTVIEDIQFIGAKNRLSVVLIYSHCIQSPGPVIGKKCE